MRVALVTGEEPLYLPAYVEPVLRAHGDDVVAVVRAPPRGPLREQLRRQYRTFGPVDFVRMGARFVAGRLAGTLPLEGLGGRYGSVGAVARAHGVPTWRVGDANDPVAVRRLRELEPSCLLCIVAGQKLGPELLAISDVALNLHGSLLPRYRGRAVAFWPLYYGDDETGVTAHLLTERWDAGPIVEQRRVPIADEDTMHGLYRKLAATGSELAVDLLDRLAAGEALPTRPNETTPADYHTLPTPEERRTFKRRGNEFC